MIWNPWAAIRKRDRQIDFLNRELALCRRLACEGRSEIDKLKIYIEAYRRELKRMKDATGATAQRQQTD